MLFVVSFTETETYLHRLDMRPPVFSLFERESVFVFVQQQRKHEKGTHM